MQGLSPDFSRACPAGLFLLMAGLLRPVPVQGWSPQGCFPQGLSCPGLALLRAALMAVPVELLSSGPVLVKGLSCSKRLCAGLFLFTFNDRSLEQHDRQQIKFKTSLSAK